MREINNVHFEELEAEKYWSFPKSFKGDKKAEVRNMIFSGEYLGAKKIDGAYYRFIKDMDGYVRLQGRSRGVGGDFLDKLDRVPHLLSFFDLMPNGTCLLGEIFLPDNEGSNNVTKIMGCGAEKAVARQEKTGMAHYYIFDVWAYDGESFLGTPFEERIEKLDQILRENPNRYVEAPTYLDGENLWDLLEETLVSGGEGIVMTKKGTTPAPGKRTARKTLKVKKELADTIDCFFTGVGTTPTRGYTGKEIENWKYWENMETGEKLEGEFYKDYYNGSMIEPVTKPYFNGWVSSLEIGVVKGDKVVAIGTLSGLPDEIKANHSSYKGRVVEVSCMEVHETGGLRHAKMEKFRDDKNWKECTWETIFGEK